MRDAFELANRAFVSEDAMHLVDVDVLQVDRIAAGVAEPHGIERLLILTKSDTADEPSIVQDDPLLREKATARFGPDRVLAPGSFAMTPASPAPTDPIVTDRRASDEGSA